MARISEFEQTSVDTSEIAITESEYERLIAGNLQLRISTFDRNGNELSLYDISTAPASWDLDSDTGEYVNILSMPKDGNHNGLFFGMVLGAVGNEGQATDVYDAYMFDTFGPSQKLDPDRIYTIQSSSWLPEGTEFTTFMQDDISERFGGNTNATIRWDAPDNVGTPLAGYGSGLGDTGTAPLCFTSGTNILTSEGNKPIEEIKVGELIETVDHGPQPVRWIGSRKLSAKDMESAPNTRPITISAGALADNIPRADLTVSPQHRVLVRSKIAKRMFETEEVLIAAKHLLELDGVEISNDHDEVEYFHILFDRHEIILSNGAKTESLHTGPMALKSLSPAARREIFTIFPELENINPTPIRPEARPLIPGAMGRRLTYRHAKNNLDLLE